MTLSEIAAALETYPASGNALALARAIAERLDVDPTFSLRLLWSWQSVWDLVPVKLPTARIMVDSQPKWGKVTIFVPGRVHVEAEAITPRNALLLAIIRAVRMSKQGGVFE